MTASILATASERIQPNVPALVLFGRDESGKPHAAWFDAGEVELATKAADLMKMRPFRPETDEHRSLAEKLPRGRVFGSGKAFAPFVRTDLYRQLLEFVGEPAPVGLVAGVVTAQQDAAAEIAEAGETGTGNEGASGPALAETSEVEAAASPPDSTGGKLPRDWSGIGLGSLVLACESPGEGWFEANVIAIDGDRFKLRWQDFPEDGSIFRRRGQLALLPPGQA